MPKALVYDCFSGISGDMHIGAMLDLGVSEALLKSELAKLSVADEFTLQVQPGSKLGITGTQATVKLNPSVQPPVRHLSDVTEIIDSANYSASVRNAAVNIFTHIAKAEAKIHGTSIEAVHFHEVGATDSIVDIVAAAICLEQLDVSVVGCMSLELGGGMVRCAHGVMPVPAPATAELLTGIPCRYGGVDQEATTPTGAAILKHAMSQFGVPDQFVAERIGYGLGQKDFAIPNVLRVMLGEIAVHPDYDVDTNQQVECNIDDMSPEAFTPLIERLFAGGAKDVFMTPIIMKKSRPGTKLTLLCSNDELENLLDILFHNSTTIGVRVNQVEKRMLPRSIDAVDTSLGRVQIKTVRLPSGRHRWKVEHDDVERLAAASGMTYLETAKQLQQEIDAHREAAHDR
jgi:uncharacterized protein (TIGR00299 family) protein